MNQVPAFGPIDPQEFAAQVQAAHERAHMAAEDASNRVRALIEDELTTEQLDALRILLSTISENAVALSNFWEGRVSGIIAERNRMAKASAHGFITDTVDLDNPSCAFVDDWGTRCNLPPSNARHHS